MLYWLFTHVWMSLAVAVLFSFIGGFLYYYKETIIKVFSEPDILDSYQALIEAIENASLYELRKARNNMAQKVLSNEEDGGSFASDLDDSLYQLLCFTILETEAYSDDYDGETDIDYALKEKKFG